MVGNRLLILSTVSQSLGKSEVECGVIIIDLVSTFETLIWYQNLRHVWKWEEKWIWRWRLMEIEMMMMIPKILRTP